MPFRQDHAFFYDRAIRYIDRDDIEQAAYFAARAAMLDDKNQQCRLELAGIYSEMGRFARSNEILFGLIAEDCEDLAECWLGVGCNFAAMQLYGCARDALHHCLALEKGDTLRAQDAQDVLEPIEDYCEGDEEDRTTWYLHHRVMEARDLLHDGRLQEAEALFSRLDAVEPLFMDVRNDLARTLFLRGERQEAIRLCLWVVKRYPTDVIALCSLADFYRQTHETDEMHKMLSRVRELSFERDMESTDDLLEVARTLYRAGDYEQALARLSSLLRLAPCEQGAMHLCAACHYMCGRYDAAADFWRRMTRIDPEDAVSDHYLRHAIRVKNRRIRARRTIPDVPVLPESESMRRLVRIKVAIQDIPAARQKWQSQHEMRALIRWGCTQPPLRKTLAVFLCMMADDAAARMLRAMLLSPSYDESFKRHVCAALKTMDAREPYYLCANDALAQVRVNKRSASELKENAPLALALEHAKNDPTSDMSETLCRMWDTYLASMQETPRFRAPQAYAAALEYCYWLKCGEHMTKSALIRSYGATLASFNRALARLSAALADFQID